MTDSFFCSSVAKVELAEKGKPKNLCKNYKHVVSVTNILTFNAADNIVQVPKTQDADDDEMYVTIPWYLGTFVLI